VEEEHAQVDPQILVMDVKEDRGGRNDRMSHLNPLCLFKKIVPHSSSPSRLCKKL
jgi:hypothetical protein